MKASPDSSPLSTMILMVHVDGAPSYDIVAENWQQSLDDAIRREAETIADYSEGDAAQRNAIRDRVIDEMANALRGPGDRYRTPDGVGYSLVERDGLESTPATDTLTTVDPEPTVEEVLSFETLPLASGGRRQAVVRWSDGSESVGLRWFPDEVVFCEGDIVDKTASQLRSLHFRRDRDWIQS